MIHENTPDHLRRNAEEMSAILPPNVSLIDHPQIGFMHQCGALQRVIRPLLAEIAASQSTQLAVDEWRKLL